jgi:hypothetical protein
LRLLDSAGPAPRSRRSRGRPAVFVDYSGRRRRLMVVVGTAVGSVLLATLGLLIAGLTGASPVRVPGFPDSGRVNVDQQAPAIAPQPSTLESAPGAGSTAGVPPTPGATSAESENRRVPTQTPSHRPKPTKP